MADVLMTAQLLGSKQAFADALCLFEDIGFETRAPLNVTPSPFLSLRSIIGILNSALAKLFERASSSPCSGLFDLGFFARRGRS